MDKDGSNLLIPTDKKLPKWKIGSHTMTLGYDDLERKVVEELRR